MEIIQMDVFRLITSLWYLCNRLPHMFFSALKGWITEKCGKQHNFSWTVFLLFQTMRRHRNEVTVELRKVRKDAPSFYTDTLHTRPQSKCYTCVWFPCVFSFHLHFYHFSHFWFKAHLCPVLSAHTYLLYPLISYWLVLQYLGPFQTDTKA